MRTLDAVANRKLPLHDEEADRELKKDLPELHEWLMPFGRYQGDFFTYEKTSEDSPIHRVRMYSQTYYYTIVVHGEEADSRLWYMGGYMNTRAPRAGEEHTRGNDLPDGKYTKETFDKIIQSAFSLELVEIGASQK